MEQRFNAANSQAGASSQMSAALFCMLAKGVNGSLKNQLAEAEDHSEADQKNDQYDPAQNFHKCLFKKIVDHKMVVSSG